MTLLNLLHLDEKKNNEKKLLLDSSPFWAHARNWSEGLMSERKRDSTSFSLQTLLVELEVDEQKHCCSSVNSDFQRRLYVMSMLYIGVDLLNAIKESQKSSENFLIHQID